MNNSSFCPIFCEDELNQGIVAYKIFKIMIQLLGKQKN